MKNSNLCIVSKPFDVDQVIAHLSDENIDIENMLWVIIFFNNKQFTRIKKYLSLVGAVKIKTLPNPILLDYISEIPIVQKHIKNKEIYFNKNLGEKKEVLKNIRRNSFIKFYYFLISSTFKIFLYYFSKLFWMLLYFYYNYKINIENFDTLITQAFPSKLMILTIKKFDSIIFYCGGRHSIFTNEEHNINEIGLTKYFLKILNESRSFGVPKFLVNKIITNIPNNYYYKAISSTSQNTMSSNFVNRKKLFEQKKIDKRYVLVAGSFEVINKHYIFSL